MNAMKRLKMEQITIFHMKFTFAVEKKALLFFCNIILGHNILHQENPFNIQNGKIFI